MHRAPGSVPSKGGVDLGKQSRAQSLKHGGIPTANRTSVTNGVLDYSRNSGN